MICPSVEPGWGGRLSLEGWLDMGSAHQLQNGTSDLELIRFNLMLMCFLRRLEHGGSASSPHMPCSAAGKSIVNRRLGVDSENPPPHTPRFPESGLAVCRGVFSGLNSPVRRVV